MVSLYRSILILVATVLVLYCTRALEGKSIFVAANVLGNLVAYIEELRLCRRNSPGKFINCPERPEEEASTYEKKKRGLPEGVTRASRTYYGRSDQPATTMFNLPRINFSIASKAESILCRLEGSRGTINLHIYE